MTRFGRVIACAVVLVTILGTCFVFVPSDASATEFYGTSPSFATGQTWSLDVGWANVGDIITWAWATSDSLVFSFHRLPATVYSGLTDYDGIVVDTAGEFVLSWYNNNLILSATVSYWVAVFTPSTTIATPIEGAYLNSRTISVQGMTDPYSYGVLVGPDALHFKEASWSGDNWGVFGYQLQEGQNTILVRTYYWLDYYGYKNITYDRTIHVVVDTTPPDLQITSPQPDSYFAFNLTASWSCSDDSGIVKREVKVDAADWIEITSGSNSYTSLLPDGSHTLQVRVTDRAGNQAVKSVNFTVDSTPPTVTIVSPQSGDYTKLPTIQWSCLDSIGISRIEISIDSASAWQVVTGTEYNPTLSDGEHYAQVRVTDKAGNQATASVMFYYDNTPPTLQIASPKQGASIRGNDVNITWQSSDTVGVKETTLMIDGLSGGAVTGNQTQHVKLSNGEHTVSITVTDYAGNTVTKNVTFEVNARALSFGGPYYGLPLVAIIVGVISVGFFIALTVVRKRHAPAAPPPQPPMPPPGAPPPSAP